MTIAGIIAEYNPFHNGHKYHIEETRRRTGADFIIAAISGDFVQRGAPALLDKFLRAKMALENGADLVLELPVTTALSSAEGFATGGVCLMERLGVVDSLSFGCESAENSTILDYESARKTEPCKPDAKTSDTCFSALFQQTAKLLAEEPPAYRARLQSYLKTGMSFPKARQLAIMNFLCSADAGACMEGNPLVSNTDSGKILSEATQKAIADLLSLPNNTLALEYQKAIYRHGAHLKTCVIPRRGGDYGDTALAGEFSSAAAIREALFSCGKDTSTAPSNDCGGTSAKKSTSNCLQSDSLGFLRPYVPASVFSALNEALRANALLSENEFSDLLFYALLSNRDRLLDYAPANSDLTARIGNLLEQFEDMRQFTALLKTKNQTYTAISRSLFRILLGITRDDLTLAKECQYAPYARVLGFRESAAPLLKEIAKKSELPIIRQPAKDRALLSPQAQRLFALDVFASGLYNHILFTKSGIKQKNDLRHPLVVL